MALNTIEAPYIVADIGFQGPGTGITGLLTSNFNYTAPFTGAVQRTVTSKLADVVSVMDFGADPTGTNDSTTAIQNAINAAQGSSLLVPSGTYLISGTLLVSGPISILGEGISNTVLLKKTGSSGHILDALSTTLKTDILIQDISFNVNSVDSGIGVQYVQRFTVNRCQFLNIVHWGIWVGDTVGTESTIRNDTILITDCSFYNSSSTYEQLLVFNSQNVTIRDCWFSTGSNAIGIGVYQNLNDVLVQRCKFTGGLNTGVYYSQSCNNIKFDYCTWDGCISGLKGANQSDHGAFGFTVVRNLTVSHCTFTNCTGVPCQIGAVEGAIIEGCVFDSNVQMGCVINNGNTPVSYMPFNIVFKGCTFRNNNTAGGAVLSSPGVEFAGVGGSQFALFSGCNFIDDSGNNYQAYPVVFNGAFTWSNVIFQGCNLNAYAGAYSVGQVGGATFGSGVFITPDCQNISANLPTLGTMFYPNAWASKWYQLTYSSSVTIDSRIANAFKLRATDANALTINAPTNPTIGQRFALTIENLSSGAMGTITWNAIFKMSAWTNPANGNGRTIDFQWNGGNWVQVSQTGVDVPL